MLAPATPITDWIAVRLEIPEFLLEEFMSVWF